MIKGGRVTGGAVARGVCPVCRSTQRLLAASGKVFLHGRSAVLPRGCPGSYQPPLRTDAAGNPVTGGTVVGFQAGDSGPTARAGDA